MRRRGGESEDRDRPAFTGEYERTVRKKFGKANTFGRSGSVWSVFVGRERRKDHGEARRSRTAVDWSLSSEGLERNP